MDKVVGVSVKPPRRRCRADVSQTLPRSQPDTCLQTWASAQTLSDTPRRSQAAPRNGRTHLTFQGRVSWREGDAGSALSPERERRKQKPLRENEAPRQGGAAPALPAPRSPSHLHAGHSADTCLSNFPQAPRHIKPLYRAGTSFLFSLALSPGPGWAPTGTRSDPSRHGGLCLRGAVAKRPSPREKVETTP